MWTIKKYLDSGSKFSLVYALQEADCDRNKLRYDLRRGLFVMTQKKINS